MALTNLSQHHLLALGVVPVVSGVDNAGQVLQTTTGTWPGSGTLTYTYQWERESSSPSTCVSSGSPSWQTISGATGSSYTLTSADIGCSLEAVVTATNTGGSASAASAATADIAQCGPGYGNGANGAVTLAGNLTLNADICATTFNTNGYGVNTNGWRILATTSIYCDCWEHHL